MTIVPLPERRRADAAARPDAPIAVVVAFPASRTAFPRLFAQHARRMDGLGAIIAIRSNVNKLTRRRIAAGVPKEIANRQAAEIETAALVRYHLAQRRPGDAA